MPSLADLDAITQDQLIAGGATRWLGGEDVIGAFVAEMDFGTAEPVARRLHEEVDRGSFGYLPARLSAELKQATIAFLRRRTGWEVAPEDVHEMPDVISVLEVMLEHFVAPGAKVIVPTPAYMPFLQVPGLHGREILQVEMLRDETGRYRYDLEALEAAFDDGGELLLLCNPHNPTGRVMEREVIEVPMVRDEEGRYRCDLDALEAAFDDGGELLLLCNPHNPTGRVMEREELEQIAELVERKDARVFADEIWMPLVLEGTHIPYASLSPATAGHTITAVAATKAFNIPGLKCAQMITSNERDRARFEAVGHITRHRAANLGLAATSTAYEEGEAWLEDVLDYLRRNRDTVIELVGELLPRARLTSMEGTYVAWLDLGAYGIQGSLHDHLLEHARVECTDGTDCGASGTGHVRFIYAMPRPLLIEALTRLARVLEG